MLLKKLIYFYFMGIKYITCNFPLLHCCLKIQNPKYGPTLGSKQRVICTLCVGLGPAFSLLFYIIYPLACFTTKFLSEKFICLYDLLIFGGK